MQHEPPDTYRARDIARQKDLFLQEFSLLGVIGPACSKAGISRGQVNNWIMNDPAFAAAMDDAEQMAADLTEMEVVRRAQIGYEEPVIFQGVPSMVVDPVTGEERMLMVTKYSDSLLAMLMKARRASFRNNANTAATDQQSHPGVLVVPGPVSLDAWETLALEHQQDWAGRATGTNNSPIVDIKPDEVTITASNGEDDFLA